MTIVVVMPAWNEAEGITGFLQELRECLQEWDPAFIVVDDKSTDETPEVVAALRADGFPVEIVTNSANVGHGPSTLRALRLGLERQARAIVALDGDGQFMGADVNTVVAALSDSTADIVEGVRRSRNDPVYRTVVSTATRTLVWSRARVWPADANTPLRAYRLEALERLLTMLPPSASTPNLLISAITRRGGFEVLEVPVTSIPRRGSDSQGSTWKARSKSIPSRRFIRFCVKASGEWLSSRPAD
jgi:dolichol-phosphate mannosyltransferase